MKRARGTKPASAARAWNWGAYGLAALLLAAGQVVLLRGELKLGALVSLAGLAVALLRLALPAVPWALLMQGARSLRPAPFGGASKPRGGKEPRRTAAPAPRRSLEDLIPWDELELSRLWLLLPAGLCVVLMQLALLAESTVRAGVLFTGAILFAAVYLQDPSEPIRIVGLRKNVRTALWVAMALPLQLLGVWFLWHYQHVWLGYALTLLGTGWMIWVLWRFPLDLSLEAERGAAPELDYAPTTPWLTQQRVALKVGLVAAAGLCALGATQLGADQAGLRVILGFTGMGLFIGSFPWATRGLGALDSLPKPLRSGLGLGAALLAFSIASAAQNAMERGAKTEALWLFLLAGIILVAGLSRFDGWRSLQAAPGEAPWAKRGELLWVLALVLLAFWARRWHLNVFPYGAEGDEAGGGVWAMDTLMGRVEHPLIHQNYPLHYFSVTAFFFKLFGVTLATMRWHSVFFGTLSIFASYFFCRLFVGRWSAWLATLLMSFSYWHLHYSRFGHYNIEQVFSQMVAFYFVFRGLKTGSLRDYAVGGAAFALAMFPHMAGRLLPFQGIAFLAYLFLARRDLLRRHATGLTVFVLTAWMIAAPPVTYWLRATTVSMGRIQSVSIFDKNNTNAPVDVLAGFVQNCKVSMLMFNDMGDSRHRDNPLAPQRILEHWTAILFALAFLYVLYHWRDPLHFFLLAAFFINLSASVFSVEAPQTLRTAGNIPIVFAIIALMFGHLHRSLLELGRRWGTLLLALLLLPAVAFFSYRSAQKYFVEARNLAFDVHPTYVAMAAGQEGGPGTQAVFFATGFASSHPPVVLFTRDTPIRNFYALSEYLPVGRAADRDHLLFLVDEYQALTPYLRWLYPEAEVKVLPNELGGAPLATYFKVPAKQLQALQGLEGEAVLANGKRVALKGAAPQLPQALAPEARSVDLQGSISLDARALYRFSFSGQGDAELWVNGRSLASRRGGRVIQSEALLAKGLHRLRLQLRSAGPQDRMTVHVSAVQFKQYNSFFNQRGRAEYDLDRASTFRIAPNGFYARYYASRYPEGEAVTEVIEPVVFNRWLDSPIPGTWSARWQARVRVDEAGEHRFFARGGGSFMEVRVNGRLAWRQGADPRGEMAPPQVQGIQRLSKGWHDLEVLFSTTGAPSTEIYWARPGKAEEPLLPDRLEPVLPR